MVVGLIGAGNMPRALALEWGDLVVLCHEPRNGVRTAFQSAIDAMSR
jgi:hypothetical protein